MKDTLLQGLWAGVKFILYSLLWQAVLFHLGSLTLRAVTLGRYPARRIANHPDGTAMAGMLVLVLAWLVVVFYNHLHPLTGP